MSKTSPRHHCRGEALTFSGIFIGIWFCYPDSHSQCWSSPMGREISYQPNSMLVVHWNHKTDSISNSRKSTLRHTQTQNHDRRQSYNQSSERSTYTVSQKTVHFCFC